MATCRRRPGTNGIPKTSCWRDKPDCFALAGAERENDRFHSPGACVMRKSCFAVLAAALCGPAAALDVVPFDADAFARARGAGRSVALQFHSGWCPVCVMQERGVRALKDEKAFEQLVVYQADYFKEDELRRRFGVASFSTLVVFRGNQERGRATGDFRVEDLRRLFSKAL